MNDYENILYEPDSEDPRIVRLTLNRPERLNALSGELLDEFFDAVARFEKDPAAYVLIVRGAGRAFSSGYDLMAASAPEPGSPGDRASSETIGRMRRVMLESVDRYLWFWNLRKPTIAQVHGYCLSGGTELSAMCDFIICAEDARFGHIAGRYMGTLRTLSLWPWTVGMRKTKEVFMTGDLFDGREAERFGMVNHAVPAEALEAETTAFAQRLIRIPLDINTLHKHSVNRWFEIMGLQAAVHSAAEFDAVSPFTGTGEDFRTLAREKGLKAALEWRDGSWKTSGVRQLPGQ
jgi:enoyl-CoA hydratase